MDTSETYIKMCRQAKEIQEDRPRFYAINLKSPYYGIDNEGVFVGLIRGEGIIWLPRQDQLQAMLELPLHNMIIDIKAFIEWENYDPLQFESMEQLWLAFVMKEKHGKVWNGEDWVNTT